MVPIMWIWDKWTLNFELVNLMKYRTLTLHALHCTITASCCTQYNSVDPCQDLQLPALHLYNTSNPILGSSIEPLEPLATDLLHSGRHQCVKIQLWCIFSAPLPDYVLNVIGLSPNPLTHFPSPLPYSLISADCLIHEPVGRSHSTATYRVLN